MRSKGASSTTIKRSSRGFSLVEILVGFAIMTIGCLLFSQFLYAMQTQLTDVALRADFESDMITLHSILGAPNSCQEVLGGIEVNPSAFDPATGAGEVRIPELKFGGKSVIKEGPLKMGLVINKIAIIKKIASLASHSSDHLITLSIVADRVTITNNPSKNKVRSRMIRDLRVMTTVDPLTHKIIACEEQGSLTVEALCNQLGSGWSWSAADSKCVAPPALSAEMLCRSMGSGWNWEGTRCVPPATAVSASEVCKTLGKGWDWDTSLGRCTLTDRGPASDSGTPGGASTTPGAGTAGLDGKPGDSGANSAGGPGLVGDSGKSGSTGAPGVSSKSVPGSVVGGCWIYYHDVTYRDLKAWGVAQVKNGAHVQVCDCSTEATFRPISSDFAYPNRPLNNGGFIRLHEGVCVQS